MIIISYFLLFLIAMLWIKYFQRYAVKKNLLDHPNTRSSHTEAKPRGGGLVFASLGSLYAILLVALGLLPIQLAITLCPSALCIAALGYLDDRLQLAARWRFSIQLLAATTTVLLLGGLPYLDLTYFSIHLGLIGYLLAAFILLWSTNLFNFMDGTDGIASVEAISVLGIGGLFLWQAGGQGLALLSWGIAASVAGFLCWNWPPAKVFMGDVGSTFLGFMIAGLALLAKVYYHVPILLWFMLYAVFCVDTTLTLTRRILTGQKWYESHCSHAYQRLHQIGWSHQRILLLVLGINILLAGLAIFSFSHPGWILELSAMSVIILGFLHWKTNSFYAQREANLSYHSESCHPERSEGSHEESATSEIPRQARDDSKEVTI
jgi:Fuc2NAc and GlcNAc transferase